MQDIDPDLSEKRCMLTYSQFKVLIKYAQLKESHFFYTVNLIWTNQFIKLLLTDHLNLWEISSFIITTFYIWGYIMNFTLIAQCGLDM